MKLAPVALFIYRRPEHTRRTLESLLACREMESTPLHIYCDGPKTPEVAESVREARMAARKLAPQTSVFVERDQNFGLARSIIEGTTDLCSQFGRVIVVEDDLEVSPSFLGFMNRGLDRYASDENVLQISGYQFPLDPPLDECSRFFSFPTSWGWATWARAWKHFDPLATGYAALRADSALRQRFDLDGSYPYFKMLEGQLNGTVDSWAIRWHLSVFMRQGLVLYPGRSLVRNSGFDGSGTHRAPLTMIAEDVVSRGAAQDSLPPVALDEAAQQRVFAFLAKQSRPSWGRRLETLIGLGKRFLGSRRRS